MFVFFLVDPLSSFCLFVKINIKKSSIFTLLSNHSVPLPLVHLPRTFYLFLKRKGNAQVDFYNLPEKLNV